MLIFLIIFNQLCYTTLILKFKDNLWRGEHERLTHVVIKLERKSYKVPCGVNINPVRG